MKYSALSRTDPPGFVEVVLKRLVRRLAANEISNKRFEADVGRFAVEELQPLGLYLLVRPLPDGHIRFIVKANGSGETCDMLDCAADDSDAINFGREFEEGE